MSGTRKKPVRRSTRLVQPADAADSETVLPPRVHFAAVARTDEEESAAMTVRLDPPAKVAATDSSDDEDGSHELFAAAPPPPPPVAKKKKPLPQKTAPRRDYNVEDASAAETVRPAAPPIQKRRSTTTTGTNAYVEQNKRRAVAREAIEAVRTMQSGVRIPHYNDTPELARLDPTERDIVIDTNQFESLLRDSPAEYQDANKPPHAPRLPPSKLAEMMTWEAMQVFSELEVRQQDWYSMVVLVAGLVQAKLSSLLVYVPTTETSGGGGDSISVRAPRRGDDDGPVAGVGASEIDRALSALTGMTPFRDPSVLAPPPPPPPVPAPPPPAAGGGAPPLPFVPDPFADEPRDGNAPLPPMSGEEIQEVLFAAVEEAVAEAVPQVAQSGARWRNFRKQAAANAPPQPYYVNDPSQAARALNQSVRQQAQAARAWVGRSVATGVYYLAPAYTAMRDSAHMHIGSRAPQLADVELRYFIRNARTGTVQQRVRVQFARLIADLFNLARHNANRSAKLATDARNLSRSAEETVRWFAARISFDPGSEQFHDNQATSYRPQMAGRVPAIAMPPGKCKPYEFCDPHSLLFPEASCTNPLLYVPGTLFAPARSSAALARRF